MPVQTCKWESFKTVECADKAGSELASRWFGFSEQDIEAKVGRFVRGKRQGKLRGWIVYMKCREGGWVYSLQTVVRPGMIFATFVEKYDDLSTISGSPLERIFQRFTRVDTCYGHEPGRTRAGSIREPMLSDEQIAAMQAPAAPAEFIPLWDEALTEKIARETVEKMGMEAAMKWVDMARAVWQKGTSEYQQFCVLRAAIQGVEFMMVSQ